jgi:hypothetical protein
MCFEEAVQARHKPLDRETRRGADDENRVVLHAVEPLQSAGHRLEGGVDTGIDELRGFGELDRTGAAREKLQAEALLEPSNLMAERRRGHRELVGRFRETQVARSRLKRSQ